MANVLEGMLGTLQRTLAPSPEQVKADYQAKLNRNKIAREAAAKLAQDGKQDPERRLAAAREVERYEQLIQANPLVIEKKLATGRAERATTKTNRALQNAGLTVPVPEVVANAPKIGFGGGVSPVGAAGQPQAPAVAAPAKAPLDVYLDQLVPGAKVTSGDRTEADQQRLLRSGYNPSPTSLHKVPGHARDIIVPKGVDPLAIVAQAKADGLDDSYYDSKRGHVHIAGKAIPGMLQANSTVAATPGAVQTGSVMTPDPRYLAGMLRAPQAVPFVNIPNAPQQEAPAELSPYVGLDNEKILADYAAAIQPVAPETASRPWDRIQAMLASAGQAAAGADPSQGFGQLLLRAGTGASMGFRAEREDQRNEDKAFKEAQRQARIALEARGFMLKGKEVDLKNFNMDRVTTNEQNKKNVKFSNMQAADQRTVQEILANHNILASNIGEGNQHRRQQDTVMVQGTQSNANAVNAATSAQAQANLIEARPTRGGRGGGVNDEIETMLAGIGVDVANPKANNLGTARATAAAILANRPDAAISTFAQELVSTPGAVQAILAPDKNDSPEVAKAKTTALKEYARAKKPEDAWGTVASLATLMNSDHAAALQIAEMFKGQSPSAALILGANKTQVAQAGAK